MDLALAGMTASIESIEQDYEGRIYLAVTVDEDPGKDLGALRLPGHRFFFQPEEVVPLSLGDIMTARYRFDPTQGRFLVHAFATGMLSLFAHSPTFAVRDFRGVMSFESSDFRGMTLDLTVIADSLELVGRVRDADRREIEGRMRREVLETAAYPEIRFEAGGSTPTPIAQNRYRLHIDGRLSLHGMTRPHKMDAELLVFSDGLVIRGDCTLRMSDYRISPVTALGGTIRLKDELAVSFDITCLPEAP
jgi:polyisoprenoid-binding protein YceI